MGSSSNPRICAWMVTSRGSGRLVGDEQLRLACDRHGDHDSLALAPRELVGIIRQPLGRLWYADERQDLLGAVPSLLLRGSQVGPQRAGDLVSDRHGGVEGGHGVLEDHGHLRAPEFPHLGLAQGGELLASKADAAAHDLPARRQQAHDRYSGHGLSAPGLTHQPDRFAGANRERHTTHRVHVPRSGSSAPAAVREGPPRREPRRSASPPTRSGRRPPAATSRSRESPATR